MKATFNYTFRLAAPVKYNFFGDDRFFFLLKAEGKFFLQSKQ